MTEGINSEQVRAFFGPDGALSRTLKGYETRTEQVAVAEAVTQAIVDKRSLVAEAGTGTGKTLAYLVPALASGLRVVVSTATRNLQDQLYEKDIPDLLAAAGIDLPIEVMKGRTNYVCLARAESEVAQGSLIEDGFVDAFRAWLANTHRGDLAELTTLPESSGFRRDVTATSEQCTGRRCRFYETCYVTQMRRRAETAQLVLVNHHLYFADAALRGRVSDPSVRLLPAHDLVIFDEAHEIDEIAAQHFGYQVSEGRLGELIRDVSARVSEEPTAIRGVLLRLERESRRLFDLLPFRDGPMRLDPGRIGKTVRAQLTETDAALGELEAILDDIGTDESLQLARRGANLAAELSFVLKEPERHSTVGEVVLEDAKILDTNPPYRDDGVEPRSETPTELPFVHFTDRRGAQRTLSARPIEVAPIMQLHVRDVPAVYISATLTVDGNFDHFKGRLGLEDINELQVGSPFDYENSARLYLPEDMPAPDTADFPATAAQRTRALIDRAGGGAFVLCTSYRMVEVMRGALRSSSRLVLCQGDAPRGRLVDTFRDHGDAVLIGTMSLWRGVDVAGSALRLVVIDKLPFASPGEPLHQARIELLRSRGIEPFRRYQLPHAALLLRQGFGRLLRRSDDCGVVAILDPRITRKGYGKLFLRSLPPCPRINTLEEVERFFTLSKQ